MLDRSVIPLEYVLQAVADPGIDFGRGTWRARGARAYNGGLGAEPPAGSRGRAFELSSIQWKRQKCLVFSTL